MGRTMLQREPYAIIVTSKPSDTPLVTPSTNPSAPPCEYDGGYIIPQMIFHQQGVGGEGYRAPNT